MGWSVFHPSTAYTIIMLNLELHPRIMHLSITVKEVMNSRREGRKHLRLINFIAIFKNNEKIFKRRVVTATIGEVRIHLKNFLIVIGYISIKSKGFLKVIPFLIGIIFGYLFSIILDFIPNGAHDLVNLTPIKDDPIWDIFPLEEIKELSK